MSRMPTEDSLSSIGPPDRFVKKIIQNGGYNPVFEGPIAPNGYPLQSENSQVPGQKTEAQNLYVTSKVTSCSPSYDVTTETVQIESKDTWLGRLSDDGEE